MVNSLCIGVIGISDNQVNSIKEAALKNSVPILPKVKSFNANIKVIGIGGGGGNAINWLYKKGVQGAEIIAVNTDKAHLDFIEADKKILIGKQLTHGLGCGGSPKVGKQSAEEQYKEIKEMIKPSDMVFITAGLGGGTGTGAAPVIAKIAQELDAIVIGTVTMPFNIEKARIDKAEFGLEELRKVCDTVIVIDNNKLTQSAGNLPLKQAFAVANELISIMIKGVVEIIAVPSLVNLDYADIKAIMSNGDVSVIGIGESDGENRVEEAVKRALSNPLLDVSYDGATGALIQITGGPDLTLEEVKEAGTLITKDLLKNANVIWGSRINNNLKGKVRILAIITGVSSPHIVGRNLKNGIKCENDLGIDFV
ncbi:MAG: cell division protein FtsZ [Nanoarchaeota archaeon]|nr:cell division protein FtsZ [Nanoarchaeota archaeon]